MPPEDIAHSWRHEGFAASVPSAWQRPLAVLLLAVSALLLLTLREWGEMLHQWWNIDTYNHILLIPAIIGWLVWIRRDDLAEQTPRSTPIGLFLTAGAMALWTLGRLIEINLFAHAGAVAVIQAAIVAILGPRIAMLLLLPLAMACFLVPFGDEIIPPLQMITAEIAIALTVWSGVPAQIDGIYINTPVGLFIVAEACSGVKFLIAMVTLAVLVCFTQFNNWRRRALFMAAAIIVPILANGVRAWGTIFIAQSQGVEFAAGFDHIFYGWIFFAIVLAIVLSAAWRYFERDPEEAGYGSAELDRMVWLARIEARSANATAILAGIVILAAIAGIAAALIPPVAITNTIG